MKKIVLICLLTAAAITSLVGSEIELINESGFSDLKYKSFRDFSTYELLVAREIREAVHYNKAAGADGLSLSHINEFIILNQVFADSILVQVGVQLDKHEKVRIIAYDNEKVRYFRENKYIEFPHNNQHYIPLLNDNNEQVLTHICTIHHKGDYIYAIEVGDEAEPEIFIVSDLTAYDIDEKIDIEFYAHPFVPSIKVNGEDVEVVQGKGKYVLQIDANSQPEEIELYFTIANGDPIQKRVGRLEEYTEKSFRSDQDISRMTRFWTSYIEKEKNFQKRLDLLASIANNSNIQKERYNDLISSESFQLNLFVDKFQQFIPKGKNNKYDNIEQIYIKDDKYFALGSEGSEKKVYQLEENQIKSLIADNFAHDNFRAKFPHNKEKLYDIVSIYLKAPVYAYFTGEQAVWEKPDKATEFVINYGDESPETVSVDIDFPFRTSKRPVDIVARYNDFSSEPMLFEELPPVSNLKQDDSDQPNTIKWDFDVPSDQMVGHAFFVTISEKEVKAEDKSYSFDPNIVADSIYVHVRYTINEHSIDSEKIGISVTPHRILAFRKDQPNNRVVLEYHGNEKEITRRGFSFANWKVSKQDESKITVFDNGLTDSNPPETSLLRYSDSSGNYLEVYYHQNKFYEVKEDVIHLPKNFFEQVKIETPEYQTSKNINAILGKFADNRVNLSEFITDVKETPESFDLKFKYIMVGKNDDLWKDFSNDQDQLVIGDIAPKIPFYKSNYVNHQAAILSLMILTNYSKEESSPIRSTTIKGDSLRIFIPEDKWLSTGYRVPYDPFVDKGIGVLGGIGFTTSLVNSYGYHREYRETGISAEAIKYRRRAKEWDDWKWYLGLRSSYHVSDLLFKQYLRRESEFRRAGSLGVSDDYLLATTTFSGLSTAFFWGWSLIAGNDKYYDGLNLRPGRVNELFLWDFTFNNTLYGVSRFLTEEELSLSETMNYIPYLAYLTLFSWSQLTGSSREEKVLRHSCNGLVVFFLGKYQLKSVYSVVSEYFREYRMN